jgi:outer membrane protein assembly factor BamB
MNCMRMLRLLTILVAAGCGEKNKPEPLSKTKSPLSEKVQHTNQDSKAKLWEFETGKSQRGVASSPAIGPDGTVYVGSYDNNLYAIKTDSKGLAKSPWPMRGQNPQHTGRAPATQ